MLEDHSRYEAEAAKMKDRLAELNFESEQMKSFYEDKLGECNERIAQLTEIRINQDAEV